MERFFCKLFGHVWRFKSATTTVSNKQLVVNRCIKCTCEKIEVL